MKLSKLYRALYFQVLVGLALGIAVGHYWPEFGASLKPRPEVFDVKRKPWINPDDASVEAVEAQVAACPSGALGCSRN